MRVSNSIIIAFLAITLAAAMAQASDIGGNVSGNVANGMNQSFIKPNTTRFYEEKSSFETNLIKLIPAPQKYTDQVPPAGASEVFYQSQ